MNNGFLFFEQIGTFFKFFKAFGIERITESYFRNGKSITGIIEHQYSVGIILVPEYIPVDLFGWDIYHRCIIDDADRSPSIRHGILILRVIFGVHEGICYISEIRDIVEVKLLEHIFVYHSRDHIVGGNYDIVACSAAFELCIKLFVSGIVSVVHLYSRQVCELGVYVECVFLRAVGDILAPVIDVYRYAFVTETGIILIVLNSERLDFGLLFFAVCFFLNMIGARGQRKAQCGCESK